MNAEKKTHKILLTNDDGIESPGLSALYSELIKIASVAVVAPETEKSAVGHGVSIFNELYLRRVYRNRELWGYALEGTPADCVKLAVTKLLKDDLPQLVISGINRGQNTGNSILYSGTVAAAVEGTMFGIPSIAVSIDCRRGETPIFEVAAKFTRALALLVLKRGMPQDVLLNVNVPNVPLSEIKGVAITQQGKAMYVDLYEVVREEGERIILRNIGEEMIPSDGGEELDDVVLGKNKISITPLHYNLTYNPFRKKLHHWLKDLTEMQTELGLQVDDLM